MKYNQEDILRLIDLAFKRYAANEALQREFPLNDIYDIDRLQSLLKNPEVQSALLILLNGIALPGSVRDTGEVSLLKAADQYPISYLGLSNRTANALSRLPGLITVGDLLRLSDREISQIRGIGPHSKSMEEIQLSRMNFIREFQEGIIG